MTAREQLIGRRAKREVDAKIVDRHSAVNNLVTEDAASPHSLLLGELDESVITDDIGIGIIGNVRDRLISFFARRDNVDCCIGESFDDLGVVHADLSRM